MANYPILPYASATLNDLLNKYSHKSEGALGDRPHAQYFHNYLTHLDVKTILVEEPYTDKDYIEDYATYYARCHEDYKKTCVRLHFFSNAFDQALIDEILAYNPKSIDAFKSGYLGFIVIKPLPSTIIGRTCLRSYENIKGVRSFPTVNKYKVHVMGIELSVDSVPFQQQDTDVAACATSAIWSALHSTGKLFHHHIPTPAKITEAAGLHQRPEGRILPASSGLNAQQMADAVRSVGLEPLIIKTIDPNFLKVAAYAYMRAHIPSMLMGIIGTLDNNKTFVEVGGHAMTLAGFSIPTGKAVSYDKSGCLFKATSIEKMYAHDDQIGPFSRLTFNAKELITTTWKDKDGATDKTFLAPHVIIAPLYHKIRIPISAVIGVISSLDYWLELGRNNNFIPLAERVTWDLYLHEVKDFKEDVFKDTKIDSALKTRLLTANLPRYIWRAEAYCSGIKYFELLFDGTDLLQGTFFSEGLPYESVMCKTIGVFLNDPNIKKQLRMSNSRTIVKIGEWFAKLI